MTRNVFFSDLALNDGNPFFVSDYDPDGTPNRSTRLIPIARADGGIRDFDSLQIG